MVIPPVAVYFNVPMPADRRTCRGYPGHSPIYFAAEQKDLTSSTGRTGGRGRVDESKAEQPSGIHPAGWCVAWWWKATKEA